MKRWQSLSALPLMAFFLLLSSCTKAQVKSTEPSCDLSRGKKNLDRLSQKYDSGDPLLIGQEEAEEVACKLISSWKNEAKKRVGIIKAIDDTPLPKGGAVKPTPLSTWPYKLGDIRNSWFVWCPTCESMGQRLFLMHPFDLDKLEKETERIGYRQLPTYSVKKGFPIYLIGRFDSRAIAEENHGVVGLSIPCLVKLSCGGVDRVSSHERIRKSHVIVFESNNKEPDRTHDYYVVVSLPEPLPKFSLDEGLLDEYVIAFTFRHIAYEPFFIHMGENEK